MPSCVRAMGVLAALAASAAAFLLGPGGASAQQASIAASVGTTAMGKAMVPGFVGVSVEYSTLLPYAGPGPRAVNPVLASLLRGLAPRQPPALRIGGESSDATWWPVRGMTPPPGVRYRLTPAWMDVARELAGALGARLILGVNLAARRPKLAAVEARALLAGIGGRRVQALEIGNEADVYGTFPWYRNKRGQSVFARSRGYSFGAFLREFARWRRALPAVPLAGPAFAELTWLSGLARLLTGEPTLRVVTIHRYPLRACVHDRSSPAYPTVGHLLDDRASSGLAQALAPYVALTEPRGLRFRVDELNSVSCWGRRGVSDTFASALWVLDTMFNLASVGVDGVNLHSRPGAAYELFAFSRRHGRWQGLVHPEYYGMLMFAQAFPPGSRLLQTNAPGGPVKVWATAKGPRVRVVLINKDPLRPHRVTLRTSAAAAGRAARLEWLRAPGALATRGVTLGGRSFGNETSTGRLPGPPRTVRIVPRSGAYSIYLPPASGVLLTQ